MMTLAQLIQRAAEQLEEADVYCGHGTDNVLDEAAWLVLHALGLPPEETVEDYGKAVTEGEVNNALGLIQKRIETRKPAAYLTQKTWFASLPFYVDERVLVPRSPLAEYIIDGFSAFFPEAPPERVLDLCTGSACIAIACAYAFPDAEVAASDLSPDALEVARINVREHHLEQTLSLHQGDLFKALPKGQRFDLIVSNPPYVDQADMNALEEEFLREPRMGLEAGDDGLDLVRTILAEARDWLNPGGWLFVEVGNSAPALEQAFPELPFAWLEFEYGGGGIFALSYEDLPQA